jgi:hypothetical protein
MNRKKLDKIAKNGLQKKREANLEIEIDLKQIALYRLMPPSQKLRIALRLYYSAWQLKEAGLRLHHPDWTEKNFRKKRKKSFYMPEANLFKIFTVRKIGIRYMVT